MTHEDIETAIDLAVAQLMQLKAEADLIAAALYLKALELERGTHHAPQRH